jgi:DNA repair protein RecO
MPYASTKAFVLGVMPLKEQDKLVHLMTADRGILKAMAPGSLKAKNRFGSLFELFTEGDYVYYWREEKELITISKGEIVNSYFNIVSQPENIFYFYLIAEIILKFVPFNQKDKRVYRLLHTILENRTAEIEMDMLLLYFLIWILRIEGMMFNPGLCYNCYRENFEKAWLKTDFRGILCGSCKTDEKFILDKEDLRYIQWTRNNPPKNLPARKGIIDPAHLIRIFKRKIEHHGEFALNSSQYLLEFR